MSFKTATAPVLAALLLSVSAGSALAQEMSAPEMEAPAGQNQEMQMPAPATPAAADFSDEQITLFAETFLQIREIGMGYEESIQGAADDDERRALIQEAEGKMTAVIQDTDGLTIADYKGINAAASANPEFAAKVQSEIQGMAS